MLKALLVFFGLIFVASCAVLDDMNKAPRPAQTRSVCDALVEQFEKAATPEHLEKASKLYQKHQCA